MVADLINTFGKTYTVKRANSAPVLVKGRSSDVVRTNIYIIASIQPAKGSEIQLLEEGNRELATIKIYTTSELTIGNKSTNLPSDIIEYNGQSYKVVHRFKYDIGTLDHNKYLAQLAQGNV